MIASSARRLRSSKIISHGSSLVLNSPSLNFSATTKVCCANKTGSIQIIAPNMAQHVRSLSSSTASPDRSYQRALELLETIQSNFQVTTTVGLDAKTMNARAIPEMIEWLNKAGYEQQALEALKVVHVAGTKGKGSTCAMISRILSEYSGQNAKESTQDSASSEQKVLGSIGLYTSPHLVTVRERIKINEKPVSRAIFAESFHRLWDNFSLSARKSGHINPTSPETKPGYFRYLTIMAFDIFLRHGVTSAVMECGIGGEYDSTNILPPKAVTVTVITKLGLDHLDILDANSPDNDENLRKIAWHKAGIMKEGAEAFSQSQDRVCLPVLRQRADERGVTLTIASQHPADYDLGIYKSSLPGPAQASNAQIAIAAAGCHLSRMNIDWRKDDIPHQGDSERMWPAKFDTALMQVEWPGRCQIIRQGNIEWYLDGAHTKESLQIALEWWGNQPATPPSTSRLLIFNQPSKSRNVKNMIRQIMRFSPSGAENDPKAKLPFEYTLICHNDVFGKPPKGWEEDPKYERQHEMAMLWNSRMFEKWNPHGEAVAAPTVEEAVNIARQSGMDYDHVRVLVVGSLHLVGGALQILQGHKQENDGWR